MSVQAQVLSLYLSNVKPNLEGILSYFAIMAGAKHVYAAEASNMSTKIKKLLETPGRNDVLKGKLTVVDCTPFSLSRFSN